MLIQVAQCATPVYRVLVVAPRLAQLPDLNLFGVGSELAHLQGADGMEVDALVGNVNTRDVAAQMLAKTYSIVHFVAHGNAEGLALSDGALSGQRIGQIAMDRRIQVMLLMTCDSASFGQVVANAGGIDWVVGAIGVVSDEVSGQFASLFYEFLQRQRKPELAFQYAIRVIGAGDVFRLFRPEGTGAVAGVSDSELLLQLLTVLQTHDRGTQEMRQAWVELKAALAASAANQERTNDSLLRAVLSLAQAIQATRGTG